MKHSGSFFTALFHVKHLLILPSSFVSRETFFKILHFILLSPGFSLLMGHNNDIMTTYVK